MILRKDHELVTWSVLRRTAMSSSSILRELPCKDEPPAQRFFHIAYRPEILVISDPFTRKQAVEGMVKIIIPLGV